MKLSFLKNWLDGNISSKEMKEVLAPYLKKYQEQSKKRGSIIPMYLIEDVSLSFGFIEFETLCKSFFEEEMNEFEVSYISELLLLSSSVLINDERIEDGLNFFCDIEMYGKFTKCDVRKILEEIRSYYLS